MSTLEYRINEALKYRASIATPKEKVNKAALAAFCNVKTPSVSNWFNGRTKELTGINLIKAAQYLKINPEWLGSGRGRMIPMAQPSSNDVSTIDLSKFKPVPLISWVQAGAWDEATVSFLPEESDTWLSCPVPHSEYTYALKVSGDSMTAQSVGIKSYPNGCTIFVDPLKRSPVNGDRIIACLKHTNEVTFKVFKNEDGRIWLEPINTRHDPIKDPFNVVGTVIGKWEE